MQLLNNFLINAVVFCAMWFFFGFKGVNLICFAAFFLIHIAGLIWTAGQYDERYDEKNKQ